MTDAVFKLTRTDRKTLALRIGKGGEIEVLAPKRCPEREIEAFVLANMGWVEKQREKQRRAEAAAADLGFVSAEELRLLAERMKEALSRKLPYYARLLGVDYGRVTVRRQKTKWGSCSGKGGLNFNVLLMLAPERVLDYVVVHELCHRKHMDHSKEFWALVGSVMPDHKKQAKWLRDNGAVLQRRVKE